jgi:hypothetical protein
MPQPNDEQIIDIWEDFRNRILKPAPPDPTPPVIDETDEDFRSRIGHPLRRR